MNEINIVWRNVVRYENGKLFWIDRKVEDFATARLFKIWNTRYKSKQVGAKTSVNRSKVIHLATMYKGTRAYVHRIIWELHYGPIPVNMFIDHIDGNGLNNLIENLRIVTRKENQQNHPIRKSNTAGLMGVSWDKSHGKFEAYINSGGKKHHLGLFTHIFDAACARKSAEVKLNFHPNHGRS